MSSLARGSEIPRDCADLQRAGLDDDGPSSSWWNELGDEDADGAHLKGAASGSEARRFAFAGVAERIANQEVRILHEQVTRA